MASTPYNLRAIGDSSVRNLIQNGNFDFWQRGITFTASAANYNLRTADRFNIGKDTTPSAVVITQSSDIPTVAQSGFQSRYSYLVTNNVTGNTPGAGDGLFISTRLEGQDYQPLHTKKVRLQFWVKSSVTGTYSFLLTNKIPGATMRIYATTYTVNSPNTWEKKTIDVTMDNTGVWNFDNTLGLQLLWGLTGGASVLTSTLNSWHTASNIEGATGQVNWTGTSSSTFQLAQVMLIPGTFESNTSVPFQRAGRTIQQELAMCQRYYEKSYAVDVTPGTVGNPGAIFYPFDTASLTRVFHAGLASSFKVPKRAGTSNIKFYSEDGTNAGTFGTVSAYNSTGTKINVSSMSSSITSGFGNSFITLASAATSGQVYIADWTVDAEL